MIAFARLQRAIIWDFNDFPVEQTRKTWIMEKTQSSLTNTIDSCSFRSVYVQHADQLDTQNKRIFGAFSAIASRQTETEIEVNPITFILAAPLLGLPFETNAGLFGFFQNLGQITEIETSHFRQEKLNYLANSKQSQISQNYHNYIKWSSIIFRFKSTIQKNSIVEHVKQNPWPSRQTQQLDWLWGYVNVLL